MRPGGNKKKSYKTQIRDLNRVLKKKDLDEKTQNEIKKKIADLEARVNITTHKEERKKYKEIHKKFKFFDKTKIYRRVEQIEKQLATLKDDEETKQKLESELDECHKKLDYIYYYPDTEYYISLYPSQPYSEAVLENQRKMFEITQAIKKKAESMKQEFLNHDVRYRKKEFKKGAEILAMFKRHEENKNIVEDNSSDLDDDFFINEENKEESASESEHEEEEHASESSDHVTIQDAEPSETKTQEHSNSDYESDSV